MQGAVCHAPLFGVEVVFSVFLTILTQNASSSCVSFRATRRAFSMTDAGAKSNVNDVSSDPRHSWGSAQVPPWQMSINWQM